MDCRRRHANAKSVGASKEDDMSVLVILVKVVLWVWRGYCALGLNHFKVHGVGGSNISV